MNDEELISMFEDVLNARICADTKARIVVRLKNKNVVEAVLFSKNNEKLLVFGAKRPPSPKTLFDLISPSVEIFKRTIIKRYLNHE